MTGTAFVHEALLYRDADEYVRGVSRFVADGLAADEPVLVAVPGTQLDLLRAALPSRVRFLDMAQVGRNPGRIIPAVLYPFAEEHGGARVRIIGEPIWPGRTDREYPGCVQHEALINVVFGERQVYILCPYDVAGLSGAAVADAALTHPVLAAGEDRRGSEGYMAPHTVFAAFNRPLNDPGVGSDALVFDRHGLAGVRQFVASHAGRCGLGRDRLAELQVAVNEVATNAVTHSSGPGSLRVWREPDRIVCEVVSPGELTDRLAGRVPPPFDSESGRGLVMVNYLCDLVQVHTYSAQTTIRLHVCL